MLFFFININKHDKTTDVLAQHNISKDDLREDWQSWLGSEAE